MRVSHEFARFSVPPTVGPGPKRRTSPLVNIGVGDDLSTAELAETISEIVSYVGDINYAQTKPDGTPRKLMDVSRLESLGWKAKTGLHEGLRAAYRDFMDKSAG